MDFARDTETGQTFIKRPGSEQWTEIEPEQYHALKDQRDAADAAVEEQGALSPVRRFAAGAKDATQDLIGMAAQGVGAVTGNPQTYSMGVRMQRANDEYQNARMQFNPALEVAAQFVDPTLFVGGGVARGVGAGARGARRGATLPQRFASTAGRVVDDSRAKGPWGTAAPEGGARAAGADVNAAPSFETTVRALDGFATPDDLAQLSEELRLGPLTTRGDEKALNARAGTDEIGDAEATRQREELFRTNILMDRAQPGGRSVNAVRDNQTEAATQVVLRELGEPTGTRLVNKTMQKLADDFSQGFEDVAAEAGDLVFESADTAKITKAKNRATADDARLVDDYVEKITDDVKNSEKAPEGQLDYETAASYRTELNADIQRAAKAGNYERAQSLGEIQDILDEIVERQLPPAVSEQLADLRYRYRIFKALQRSTATTDAGGKVNLKSFNTSLERGTNRWNRSLAKSERGEKFGGLMETLEYLTARVTPSSGSAERLLANPPIPGASLLRK